jgi:hypothetical protein
MLYGQTWDQWAVGIRGGAREKFRRWWEYPTCGCNGGYTLCKFFKTTFLKSISLFPYINIL